jgi:holo-[acyl-carrier protein] synthase
MLPIVVGVDLVDVSSIAQSLEDFGERFVSRIFTDDEIRYCRSRAPAAALESFAARFAAKEATIKALRAVDCGLDVRNIEVVRAADGSCNLRLSGAAADAARAAHAARLALSLSHTRDYAIAVVVGVTDSEDPT